MFMERQKEDIDEVLLAGKENPSSQMDSLATQAEHIERSIASHR